MEEEKTRRTSNRRSSNRRSNHEERGKRRVHDVAKFHFVCVCVCVCACVSKRGDVFMTWVSSSEMPVSSKGDRMM